MIASLSVLLVALLALVVVSSEDVRAFKHPLTDMPGPAEDVSTVQYFPNQPDLKLPIGEVITVLCHFSNEGSGYYNISGVMGSLNAPIDFRHHFQNYSYKPFGIVVKGGEEISLKYTFQLHPELDPVDYQLAVTVFYDSESESFSNTFFNQVCWSISSVLVAVTRCVLIFVCVVVDGGVVPAHQRIRLRHDRVGPVQSGQHRTGDSSRSVCVLS
jgi:hypothetical protein